MNKCLNWLMIPTLLLLALPAGGVATEQDNPEEVPGGYVRLTRDAAKKPLALETAIVRFQAADGRDDQLRIDLIGAIHIADASYFAELNRRFRQYDAVLYELVAPEEANVPVPGRNPGGAIGGMQVGMKSLLDLTFQLDEIDYKAQNLVHADMTPEQFARSMRERNESFTGMFFRIMGRSMSEHAKQPFGAEDLRLLAALFAPDRAHQMKLIMAEQFADLESQLDLFDGPDGSTIVTERNSKALEVLRRELDAGKKRLAIFYGAGHLADLQKRLEEEFAMEHVGTDWLAAWSLARPDK
jgi:hypothetical protein